MHTGVIDYYKRYKIEGLDEPMCVKMDSKDLIFEEDVVRVWLESAVIEDKGHILSLRDSWDKFIDWFEDCDLDNVCPKKKDFKKKMEGFIGLKCIKSSKIKGCNQYNFWKDYKLI